MTDAEIQRGIEMALAICKPQLDQVMRKIQEIADGYRPITEEAERVIAENRALAQALRNLLATRIQETSVQDLPPKPPTRSIQ